MRNYKINPNEKFFFGQKDYFHTFTASNLNQMMEILRFFLTILLFSWVLTSCQQQAQSQLQNCLSTIQNKEALSLYCSFLLLKSTDLNVQTYCTIIIRKIFLTSEKEISNEAVKQFSSQNKDQIKKNLLLSIQSTQNKSLQKKIADASIKVYEASAIFFCNDLLSI